MFNKGDIVKVREYEDLVESYGIKTFEEKADCIMTEPIVFPTSLKHVCGKSYVVKESKDGYCALVGIPGFYSECILQLVSENEESIYFLEVFDKEEDYKKIKFGFNLFEELMDFAETCIDHGKWVQIHKQK